PAHGRRASDQSARRTAAVELETSKSCQDLRHVQPPDAYGRVTSTPWPHRQTCDNVGNSTRRAKLPITASGQMISAQTDCRLALCLVMALRLQDQANVVALQSHRRSARPSMCCPASLVSRETMHLTSRALDRRALALKWSEQHADRVSASRTRCRLRRNT